MKRMTIKRKKPGLAKASIEPLAPHSDPPLAHHVHSVTLHVGGRRYEMTLHSEFREITKGPAQVIEMPGRSAKTRGTE
jgi:hypothetical protein